MEANIERECSALGGLFQQIITDMKNGTPLWEDLVAKATKLHTCLRATIQAIAAYLDAFQKIADAATNTRGATKEIGTALTRICLRHKAVEARMKTFTSAIMDCLVVPLQEKLEEWKKTVINLDKEHAKEYKRARAELKKRSTDTLRLQKKARKGKSGELQRRVESSMQDVTERRQLLEETEKQAVRAALIEERSRFCLLVAFLKPVVDEEVAMLSELSHLQEVVDQIQKHTADPYTLPPASEQVISDLKGSESSWSFQTPPSSPSSLGSRKSSMCSISSLNSSSSGSTKSHHSPSHHYWHRSVSQPLAVGILRLPSVSSQDSGFTSQDVLFPRPPSVQSVKVSNMSEPSSNSGSNSSTPSTPYAGTGSAVTLPNTTATWPNLQETLQFERAATAIMSERPHTISSAYERGHQRPPLTVYTFQAPDASHSQPASPVSGSAANVAENNNNQSSSATGNRPIAQPLSPKPQPIYARPPVPQRCSSLERPSVPAKSPPNIKTSIPLSRPITQLLSKTDPPKIIVPVQQAHLAKDSPQPMYVNMHELATMAASKAQEMNFPPPPPELANPAPETQEKTEGGEKDGSTSESSLESSSGYGSQIIQVEDAAHNEEMSLSVCSLEAASKYCTLPRSGESTLPSGPRRRPLSTTGYPSSTMKNALLRRGSVQGQKPPPPIRRTSSISNSARQSTLSPVGGSLENLPPPPAFLLDSGGNTPPQSQSQSPGISVADTVRTLTELKHQPASPSSLRRNSSIRSQSADRRVGETSPGSGLIAAISAKLAPNLSPRNSRRHSEDLNPNSGNRLLQRGITGPGQGFLQTLNTKLALQQQQLQIHGTQLKAVRVRQYIASRTLPDPALCHESLMDQIRRGTTLRRTGTINDRSAPKIR
ncbi:BAR/IMD domain-containing adapter protein 2-like 1 isoform X2 [Anabrus simplex]|uniref:BAR/IMD domain-containing adapter protein 2-like 1 isoform X2 n=1 Tax=Anabrus simplex TaxID=316456 RepID=UPI0034DD085C